MHRATRTFRVLPALTRPARALHTSQPLRIVRDTIDKSTLESPPSSSSTVSDVNDSPEDFQKTDRPKYVEVVAHPSDPPFAVPPGPYPSSTSYDSFPAASRPEVLDKPISSTSPNPAHPVLTKKVPTNDEGVLFPEHGIGASAAVRHATAAGDMHAAGGSGGGANLGDKSSTKPGELGELPDVNDVPQFENAKKWSDLGVKDGWKERK
jgi:hypothetical protein